MLRNLTQEDDLKDASKILSLLIFIITLAGSLFPQAQELKSITTDFTEGRVLVFIEITGTISYESFTLPRPNRLVIDLKGIGRISTKPSYDVGMAGVLRIRNARHDPTTVRIVFDLEEQIPLFTIEEARNGLIISFTRPKVEKAPAPKKEAIEEKEKEAVEEKTKPKEEAGEKQPVPLPAPQKPLKMETGKNASAGLLAGIYFMQDESKNNIYGKSQLSLGAEYTFTLPIESVRYLDLCLTFRYEPDSGLTTFLKEELKLRLFFFSLSTRYVFRRQRYSLFIGPGMDYIIYKEIYPDGFPQESTSGSTLGLHLQAGSYIKIVPFLAAKIYFKYNLAETVENENRVNLGGVEWGLGLVFLFNL